MRWTALLVTALCAITLAYAAPDPEPAMQQAPMHTTPGQPVAIEPVTFARTTDARTIDASHRNLFDFAERRRRLSAQTAIRPPAMVSEPQPQRAVQPAVQREAEFEFRYLGTFGPPRDPIAVFSRDGNILNARAGESVGGFQVDRVGFDGISVRSPSTNNVRTLPNQR